MHSASSQNTETAAIYKEIYLVSSAPGSHSQGETSQPGGARTVDWTVKKLSVFALKDFGVWWELWDGLMSGWISLWWFTQELWLLSLGNGSFVEFYIQLFLLDTKALQLLDKYLLNWHPGPWSSYQNMQIQSLLTGYVSWNSIWTFREGIRDGVIFE